MVERTVRVIGKNPKRVFEKTVTGVANAKKIRDQYLSEGIWVYHYETRYLFLHQDDIAKILIFDPTKVENIAKTQKKIKNAK